jgi:Conserved hypothetical protein (Lin0512_fam)
VECALAQFAIDRDGAWAATRGDDNRRAYRCARPDKVNEARVLAALPHRKGTVMVVDGGLKVHDDAGTASTLIANACAIVSLDIK